MLPSIALLGLGMRFLLGLDLERRKRERGEREERERGERFEIKIQSDSFK